MHPVRSPRAPLGIISSAILAALGSGSLLWAISPLRAEAENAAATLSQAAMEQGRKLFQDTGCIQCHTLADADAWGSYAPSLDGNPELTRALVLKRITEGQGDMPSYAGILSEEELAQLASYVAAAAKNAEAS